MKPNKDTSMLIDIQYVKQDKQNGKPDYLYIIWKDLDTNEKHMQAIPEPKMDIYFTKPEFRTHDYNKNYEYLDKLDKKTVKYKDIPFAIAEDMGDRGKQIVSNIINTKNFSELKKFNLYEYVYGSDYDIRAWYRNQWLFKLDNDRRKPLTKGFLDIEVDGFGYEGMPEATKCPINAVTLTDGNTMTTYTFLLKDFECKERSLKNVTDKKVIEKELERRKAYKEKERQINEFIDNIDEVKSRLGDMFHEKYGDLKFNFYFHDDERKMLVHLFQLINKLKLDMIMIWNISFDIPYIIERLGVLGLDPKDVMCHPDFPSKVCNFRKDTINYEIKKRSDVFNLSSYTIFYDQMMLYAAIRKSQKELRSYKLTDISKRVIKDNKLNYSEEGNIKTLPYRNFFLFVAYNIKDTLLQFGIEERTSDVDTLYITSYKNATPYESVFKQTIKLRNVQYWYYFKDGLIPGNNINIFNVYEKPKDDEDDDDNEEETAFEGALVARPELNSFIGKPLYGKPSNNIFRYVIDFDFSSFYPSSIIAMNIDASTLIFKVKLLFKSVPFLKKYINEYDKDNMFHNDDDIGKEAIDNLIGRNYLSYAYKWLNLPSVDEIEKRLEKKFGDDDNEKEKGRK